MFNRKSTWIGVALSLAWFAAIPAQAGEIVTCVYLKGQEEHRCIIKSEANGQARAGDNVIAYENGIYWVGTGKVVKVKGAYAVASFKNSGNSLAKGLRTEVQANKDLQSVDWSAAFSRRN